MSSSYELSDVLRSYLPTITAGSIPMDHFKVLDAISKCRTSALGGHIDGCEDCGHLRISYNSCRNRHCPKCQGLNKEMWIVMQEDMLLPVAYYHVVFTLPHELNTICMWNSKEFYNLLFRSAWYTIKVLSEDPRWIGAQTSATMLLHTWSQTLQLHPHLHCIVPNGGLDKEKQKWNFPKRGKSNFLFPVKAMQKLYKGYFMDNLIKKINSLEIHVPQTYYNKHGGNYYKWKDKLYSKNWVVYTKKPFSGVKHVIDYLGRYSHRVAITNSRIKGINSQTNEVKFEYKDYADGAKKKEMVLSSKEFVRRFCNHILPKGFRKVRQYGFTSNASKKRSISLARAALGVLQQELMNKAERKEKAMARLNICVDQCPICKSKKIKTILIFNSARPPPNNILERIKSQNPKKAAGI